MNDDLLKLVVDILTRVVFILEAIVPFFIMIYVVKSVFKNGESNRKNIVIDNINNNNIKSNIKDSTNSNNEEDIDPIKKL